MFRNVKRSVCPVTAGRICGSGKMLANEQQFKVGNFEWILNYGDIEKYINESMEMLSESSESCSFKSLVVGCGTSKLSEW